MSSKMLPFIWPCAAGDSRDIGEVLARQQPAIDALLHEHGAILFKNFNVDSLEKFQACTDRIPSNNASYIDGNSPRTKLTSNVYTSTEYPEEMSISMHNELSYSHSWPSRLYFCCIVAPLTGGSTTILDSREMLKRISPSTLAQFEQHGVSYVRNLHGGSGAAFGKSWQDTFETDKREDVEAYCKDGNIKFEWTGDGGVRLIQVRPATAVHPVTGERVWFNQVDQFHPSTNPPEVYEAIQEIYGDAPFEMPQYGCFGDGSPIPDALLAEVRSVASELSVAFAWKQGDLMVIDNMLTAHGRSPFSGPRRILVAMSS